MNSKLQCYNMAQLYTVEGIVFSTCSFFCACVPDSCIHPMVWRPHVHREEEKMNQFSFACIFFPHLTEIGEFFHIHYGKYKLQFPVFNFGMR